MGASRFADWARWFLVSLLLVAAIGVVAGRSPERFALPGLFGLGYGALVGLGAGEMACRLHVFRPRTLSTIVVLMTAVGFVGVSLQWQRLYAERSKPFIKPVPDDPLRKQLLESLTPVPAGETPQGRAAREQLLADVAESDAQRIKLRVEMSETQTIRGYLRSRWINFPLLKGIDAPWPLVLWIVELVGGMLISSAIAWRTIRAGSAEAEKAVEPIQ